jgi:hypothetical protein
VGEIIFDDEIRLDGEWVDFISLSAQQKISPKA